MKHIQLTPEELLIVQKIMQKYPKTVIFGSRAKGSSKKFSDLDVCIKDDISSYEHELLKEAFDESSLLFTVDLVLYRRCDDVFKEIIDSQGIPLYS